MSAKQMLTYSNALLVAGEYDEVVASVQDYSSVFGYDVECSYIMARLKALMGNYSEAQGIYAVISESGGSTNKIKAEQELVSAKASEDSSYVAMMDFMIENGKSPVEYGYTQEYVTAMEEVQSITDEDIKKEIISNIEDDYDVDEYEDILEQVACVNDIYDRCVFDGYYSLSDEETKVIDDFLEELEGLRRDNENLMKSDYFVLARLKALLLQGNYEELVNNLNRNSGYIELLVALELYLNDVVDEENFDDDYVGAYGENCEEVIGQLEKIVDEHGDEFNKSEEEEVENIIKNLEMAEKEPVLYALREDLEEEKDKGTAIVSKIDLGISKIEYHCDNEDMATDYFYEAVINGKESDDAEYAEAMSEIEAIVTGDDTADIIYLDNYVQQAVDNALPVDGYDVVCPDESGTHEESYEEPNGNDLPFDEGNSTSQQQESYEQVMTDYISEIKSSITIGQIDASEFDTVKVNLTISSKYAQDSEELKQLLKVYDCGVEITDYEIEKIEYSSIKTMLICDVSGSMDICIEDLKSAVINYVDKMHEDEYISIVTFSDEIEDSTLFTNNKNTLTSFASSMNVGGGTAIYNTLYTCLNDFESEISSSDTIILMTDGQDGNPRDNSTIMSEIGSLASEKGVTIYTIGLGDVDATYLETLAASGNGKLVYVSDSESLINFYELLQSQVDNQYVITYKAKDTLLAKNRSVEVRIDEENIYDYKEYNLFYEDETGDKDASDSDEVVLPASNVALYGLDVRCAQKSKTDLELHLLGTGFKKEDKATLKLLGDIDYDITLEYEGETSYKVVIPSFVSVGTYDLQVTINGRNGYIENGFSLYEAGDVKVTKFGPYTFTSMGKQVSGYKTTLSGNVTMNGWLRFNGEVVLEGNLNEDTQITMMDNAGSYVSFDTDTAEGLGKHFAKNGISFTMPRLGSFNLYNDPSHMYDYKNYQVDSIKTTTLKVFNVVALEAPAIKLYPDNIKLEYTQGTTVLPFQDEIFEALEVDSPFSFNLEGSAVVTNKNLGFIIDFEGEDERKNYKKYNFFNTPVELDANKLKIKINTIDHEYGAGGAIKVKCLDLELGAEIELKGFTLNNCLVTVDTEVTANLGQVPLTFSNFRFGAEDIAAAAEDNNYLDVVFVGQFDMAVAKVSAFFPKLEDYVDDLCLVSLSDATAKLRLWPFKLSTSSEIKLFDEFTLVGSTFDLGHYSYTNTLLGLEEREVDGFNASISAGFKWDIDNCDIDISGTGSVSGNSRFIGVQLEGVAELEVDWWIFSKTFDESGTILLGVYYTEKGEPQFTLALAYQKDGKNKKLYYYIDSDGNVGDKNGSL